MKHYKFKLNSCWQGVKTHKEAELPSFFSDSDYIFRRLTANVQEASTEEAAEVLNTIENLTDDDMIIVKSEHYEHYNDKHKRRTYQK